MRIEGVGKSNRHLRLSVVFPIQPKSQCRPARHNPLWLSDWRFRTGIDACPGGKPMETGNHRGLIGRYNLRKFSCIAT